MTQPGEGSGCPPFRWAGIGADVDPLTLGRGGGEGQHPHLPKNGTYFLLDDDVVDVMQVSPKSLLAPNPELEQIFLYKTQFLCYPQNLLEEKLVLPKFTLPFCLQNHLEKSQIFGCDLKTQ